MENDPQDNSQDNSQDDSQDISIPVYTNLPWADWCAPHDDITVPHLHTYDDNGNDVCTEDNAG